MRITPNLARAPWRKSSYSTAQSDCVEVAPLPRAIAIRDSKRPHGPALVFPVHAFAAFIRAQA